MAYAVLAYAAKVLKELHESQVVAGKGAGTRAAQTHEASRQLYEMQGSSGFTMLSKTLPTP